MELVNQVFAFIAKFFEWYFVVMPWEQAVFIRSGNKVRVLDKGLYFKIPFVDRIYIQQTRLRNIDSPMQTVSTLDGKTLTIKSLIGYSIKDVYKMLNNLSHPDTTLSGMVMSRIAEYVFI